MDYFQIKEFDLKNTFIVGSLTLGIFGIAIFLISLIISLIFVPLIAMMSANYGTSVDYFTFITSLAANQIFYTVIQFLLSVSILLLSILTYNYLVLKSNYTQFQFSFDNFSENLKETKSIKLRKINPFGISMFIGTVITIITLVLSIVFTLFAFAIRSIDFSYAPMIIFEIFLINIGVFLISAILLMIFFGLVNFTLSLKFVDGLNLFVSLDENNGKDSGWIKIHSIDKMNLAKIFFILYGYLALIVAVIIAVVAIYFSVTEGVSSVWLYLISVLIIGLVLILGTINGYVFASAFNFANKTKYSEELKIKLEFPPEFLRLNGIVPTLAEQVTKPSQKITRNVEGKVKSNKKSLKSKKSKN